MTGFADVQACAMAAWATVPLTYPVAREGRDFSPPSDAAWVALYTLPVSTRAAAVGAGSPLEHLVLLQVDLHQPLNTGTA